MERRPDRRRKRTEIGDDPQGDSDPHGLFLSTSVAPRIVVDPKPTTTDIGSDVTLTCVWVGNPPLTLTWTKKDSNMVRSLSGMLEGRSLATGWGERGQRRCSIIFQVEPGLFPSSQDLEEKDGACSQPHPPRQTAGRCSGSGRDVMTCGVGGGQGP